MPSAAALTVYAFGGMCLVAGLTNLAKPEDALAALDLPATARFASNGMALAAVAMGLYYPLAAWQENTAFFALTVPMRLLTATVFWLQGGPWRVPAAWEGSAALLTGLALAWDLRGARGGGGEERDVAARKAG